MVSIKELDQKFAASFTPPGIYQNKLYPIFISRMGSQPVICWDTILEILYQALLPDVWRSITAEWWVEPEMREEVEGNYLWQWVVNAGRPMEP